MSKLALFYLRFAVFVILLGSVTPLLGQPVNPPDPDVPISGIEILIALGGLLGIKKISDLRKKK